MKSVPSIWPVSNLLFFVLLSVAAPHCKLLESSTKTPNSTPKGSSSTKESTLRKNIVDYAVQYKGYKYTYAGKSPKSGFDCSGFTSYVMSNFDITLSPSSREQAKQGKSKPVADAEPGDLIFFRRSASEPIFHVALVISHSGQSLKVVHSTTSRGVVIDDIMASTYWKPYIDSAREVVR